MSEFKLKCLTCRWKYDSTAWESYGQCAYHTVFQKGGEGCDEYTESLHIKNNEDVILDPFVNGYCETCQNNGFKNSDGGYNGCDAPNPDLLNSHEYNMKHVRLCSKYKETEGNDDA